MLAVDFQNDPIVWRHWATSRPRQLRHTDIGNATVRLARWRFDRYPTASANSGAVHNTPSGIDSERVHQAFSAVQRQAGNKRKKLTTEACLDLAWRTCDALGAIQPTHRRA